MRDKYVDQIGKSETCNLIGVEQTFLGKTFDWSKVSKLLVG